MAAGAWTFYNTAKKHIADGSVDLDTNSFKMALFTSASNAATVAGLTAVGSITSEVSNVNGYVTSGKAITAVTWLSGASASEFRFDSTAVVWTASAGDIANVKYAVVYKVATTGARKILMFSQLSTSQFTVTSGNTLTITPSANGYFELN